MEEGPGDGFLPLMGRIGPGNYLYDEAMEDAATSVFIVPTGSSRQWVRALEQFVTVAETVGDIPPAPDRLSTGTAIDGLHAAIAWWDENSSDISSVLGAATGIANYGRQTTATGFAEGVVAPMYAPHEDEPFEDETGSQSGVLQRLVFNIQHMLGIMSPDRAVAQLNASASRYIALIISISGQLRQATDELGRAMEYVNDEIDAFQATQRGGQDVVEAAHYIYEETILLGEIPIPQLYGLWRVVGVLLSAAQAASARQPWRPFADVDYFAQAARAGPTEDDTDADSVDTQPGDQRGVPVTRPRGRRVRRDTGWSGNARGRMSRAKASGKVPAKTVWKPSAQFLQDEMGGTPEQKHMRALARAALFAGSATGRLPRGRASGSTASEMAAAFKNLKVPYPKQSAAMYVNLPGRSSGKVRARGSASGRDKAWRDKVGAEMVASGLTYPGQAGATYWFNNSH